ncbi:MAG: zinc ribbon domain-containing protein [Oscillospiraceae bacterium]|nr:zinc ribbon domain-containing protein [Oscillospiraceae bacterium]
MKKRKQLAEGIDGKFVYKSLEELTNYLVAHMSNENWPPEQARRYFEEHLPKLNYWNNKKMP